MSGIKFNSFENFFDDVLITEENGQRITRYPPPPKEYSSVTDFINWLKGFVSACHDYAPTPKQWDMLKEKLNSVKNI